MRSGTAHKVKGHIVHARVVIVLRANAHDTHARVAISHRTEIYINPLMTTRKAQTRPDQGNTRELTEMRKRKW